MIFIFTYTLLGMELFANKTSSLKDDHISEFIVNKHTNPSNFNSFFEAFLSVFIVLANNNWFQIYAD